LASNILNLRFDMTRAGPANPSIEECTSQKYLRPCYMTANTAVFFGQSRLNKTAFWVWRIRYLSNTWSHFADGLSASGRL